MSFLSIFSRATTGEVDVAEAERRQKNGAVIVDVREPDEWASGHVPGALHIPLGHLARRLGEVPREGDVLFICRSGNRSGVATLLARRAGIGGAKNVRGGMIAWNQARLPSER